MLVVQRVVLMVDKMAVLLVDQTVASMVALMEPL